MSAALRQTIFVPHCSSLLTDHRPHGDGLIAHGFLRRLAERGHDLHIAACEVDLAEPLPPNAHVHVLSPGGNPIRSRLGYMLAVRQLFRGLQRDVRFSLIHQFNPVYTGISLALAGSPLPLVLGPYIPRWPHDPSAVTSSYASFRRLLSLLNTGLAAIQQQQASRLLVTTQAATDRVPRAHALRERIVILPHGIDARRFHPAAVAEPADSSGSQSVNILFLANLVRRKGLLDLISAFERIEADFPDALLTIAGDGPESMEARARAAASQSAARIRFVGAQSREQAVALFQIADIYCLPSHGEPFGMTAVEAMSCGLPVVGTDAGGLACLIDDAGGIRVPVGDATGLAAALATLLEDAGLRRRMGQYNRQRVLKSMDWECVIDRLEEIYADAVNEHNSSQLTAITPPLRDGQSASQHLACERGE
jgi:glycosyltransferase involved in cell wall biosynthesis